MLVWHSFCRSPSHHALVNSSTSSAVPPLARWYRRPGARTFWVRASDSSDSDPPCPLSLVDLLGPVAFLFGGECLNQSVFLLLICFASSLGHVPPTSCPMSFAFLFVRSCFVVLEQTNGPHTKSRSLSLQSALLGRCSIRFSFWYCPSAPLVAPKKCSSVPIPVVKYGRSNSIQ